MNCEQVEEQLLSYAFGALDAAERLEVEAHLATGCATCAAALARAGATAASLAYALPPADAPPGVRARLLSRARESADFADRGPMFPPPRPRPWPARALLAACLLVTVSAVGFALSLAGRAGRRAAELQGQVDSLRDQVAQLRDDQARTARALRLVESPAVRMVSLDGKEQPQACGRIFWDRPHGVWHFHAAGLRSAGSGRVYELWAINDQQKETPAGTFEVDDQGEGELDVPLPPAAGRVSVAAVTDEPLGGRPKPTGKVQMAGKAE